MQAMSVVKKILHSISAVLWLLLFVLVVTALINQLPIFLYNMLARPIFGFGQAVFFVLAGWLLKGWFNWFRKGLELDRFMRGA